MINFKEVRVIDLMDWDALVVNTYQRPYSFQQQNDCKSRGIHHFTVPEDCYDDNEEYMNTTIPEEVNGDDIKIKFSSWLARPPKLKLKSHDEWAQEHGLSLFWGRNFYPDFNTLLNDLYKKELIEDGDYLIDMDW